MIDLIELAARVEREEPRHELELAVARSTMQPCCDTPLQYLTSMDAAITLVPEGWSWLVKKDRDQRFALANVYSLDTDGGKGVWNGDFYEWECAIIRRCARGRTPAAALTAASLRARAAQEKGE